MTDDQLDIFNQNTKTESPLSWKSVLAKERQAPYFKQIIEFIEKERASAKVIYPKNKDIFNAFALTEFNNVKVVILGQDPYHGPNQAHGLCFSVQENITPPPSLVNIFKELESDLGLKRPEHGKLSKWARQGVLLLNAVLSVEASKPGSHANIGWETFTDNVIKTLSDKRSGLVFLLWGAYAQKKGSVIDRSKHTVLKAPHPSPLSASRGFFGCKHFSKTNEILRQQGLSEIDWAL